MLMSGNNSSFEQENPCNDSGSSFKPLDTDVQSDSSSDDLPLARLIIDKRPKCDLLKPKKSSSKRQCNLIGEEDRQQMFQRFLFEMDWKQRKTFVAAMVTKSETKQKTTKQKSRRQTTFSYHLRIGENLFAVCKKLFLSTLGLNEWSVSNWVRNSNAGIPNIIEKYQEKTASTSKLYLEPIFRSYSEVYEIYNKEVESPSGKDVFVAEIKKLNIDIFHPSKDQCDLCFSNKLSHGDNETYNIHIEEKNKARREKEKDKEDSVAENAVTAFTVDVQAVLLVPQLHASMLYFKQKLACHNYTIYNIATKAVVCYVWHDGEAKVAWKATVLRHV
ncbi:uncharacterized protein LOC115877212 [Sitophilus oryzae]|uniref:Uncharacterized protein LOC115877212 n=1 Tax=Sitophilus oryzae TaxID=7048 RepID=A0A6J2XDL3_SITOR|nr:uncharacterized protein LOC115877212 [Sitophilus oryzae]